MARLESADYGVLLLLAIPALLPFGAAPELPLLLCALAGIVMLLRGTIRWRAEASTRLVLILFAAYWLPELFSAFDSVAPRKSWTEVAADLRFLPMLLFASAILSGARQVRIAAAGMALLLALWCADALVQATLGTGLGGAVRGDRLSGIFGDSNLKLGGVIAVLAPFGLLWIGRRCGARALLLGLLPILLVVLLAGARAAWISLALVTSMVLFRQLGAKSGALALALAFAAAAVAGIGANLMSTRFAERVDRTAMALRGDRAELDHALSGRLPIWQTAVTMSAAHPVNGVGVRGFRHAYPEFAADDDPFVQRDPAQGALHAHQILLELLSETGIVGLLCWVFGIAFAWRCWRRADAAARTRSAAPLVALVAMLFPLNTHYAVYSNFWSILLFSLLALWIGMLHSSPGDR
jgi:O-antigen ligase